MQKSLEEKQVASGRGIPLFIGVTEALFWGTSRGEGREEGGSRILNSDLIAAAMVQLAEWTGLPLGMPFEESIVSLKKVLNTSSECKPTGSDLGWKSNDGQRDRWKIWRKHEHLGGICD